jgi:hypothetical protein
MKYLKRFLFPWTILVGLAIWIPSLRYFFEPKPRNQRVQALLNRKLVEINSPQLVPSGDRMANPEYELLDRYFLVLSLVNQSLLEKDEVVRKKYTQSVDTILNRMVSDQQKHGQSYFHLPYFHSKRFKDPHAQSLFLDGEFGMMLAARLFLGKNDFYHQQLEHVVQKIERQLTAGPVLSGESYPDECWTFDNTLALDTLYLADRILGTNHNHLIQQWILLAKQRLLDPKTGLLVASYRYDGTMLQGAEGSGLWLPIHNLLPLDETFAKAQYQKAKGLLARSVLGFGFAREWEHSGQRDVDSGPVVPLIGASPGSSGLFLVAASAMDDQKSLTELERSLDLTAFPIWDSTGLRYAGASGVGDSVLLYALSYGPLFQVARHPNFVYGKETTLNSYAKGRNQ